MHINDMHMYGTFARVYKKKYAYVFCSSNPISNQDLAPIASVPSMCASHTKLFK